MGAAAAMWSELRDLVLPRRCLGCALPGVVLCPDCRGPIATLSVALPIEGGDLIACAAGAYADALRTAVLAFKERGRRDLGPTLAGLLAEAVEQARSISPPGRTVLVPVPSTRAAARARGGAHMLRLARAVARINGLQVAPDALRLQRATRDSAGLGIADRQANLAGAMWAAPAPAAVTALVVDDVITTGATLAESVRALRRAGWTVGGVAVIAATPRRFPRHPEQIRFSPSGAPPSGLA